MYMNQSLPKHLQITLDGLLCDSVLSSWTVHGNSAMTTLTIRFKMESCTEEHVPDDQLNGVKYK